MRPEEGIAVLFSITYVLLAAKEHIGCWVAAVISNILFIYIFLDVQLYSKVLLRFFYLFLAFYGFYQWKYGYKNKKELPVRMWLPGYHLIAILGCTVLSLIIGWGLSYYTEAASPYLDTSTTIFSFFTTWLVTRKYLENWLYWIVIDTASAFLYAGQGLHFTTFLYLFFTIAAIFGFFKWRKSYQKAQLPS